MKNFKYIFVVTLLILVFVNVSPVVFAYDDAQLQQEADEADAIDRTEASAAADAAAAAAAAVADDAASAADAAKVKPPTIACPPGLPCITKETQSKGGKSVRDYVLQIFGGSILKWMLGIISVTCVVFIIIGGLQMLLALGTEEDINKAKKTLLWAIAGLVISILSVAVVQIVTNLSF